MTYNTKRSMVYLTYFYPPFSTAGALRAKELSQRLPHKDIIPMIVSASETKYGKDFSLLDEIKFSIFPIKYDSLVGLISTFKLLLANKNQIEWILASGPPFITFLYGLILKFSLKKKLILEYRDPWIFNPYHEKSKLFNHLNRLRERIYLKFADRVLFISNSLKNYVLFYSSFKNAQTTSNRNVSALLHKSYVLPNSYKRDFELLKEKTISKKSNPLDPEKSFSTKNKRNDKIFLILTHSLYGKRNPRPLFEVLSRLKDEGIISKENFEMRIYGQIADEILIDLEHKQLTDLLKVPGIISHEECLNQQEKATFVVDISEISIDYPTFPFHYWEYFTCGKRILFFGNPNSAKARYIRKNDFGYIFNLQNHQQLYKKFKSFILEFRKGKIANELNLSTDFLEKNSWESRIEKLIRILDEI